MKRTARNRSFGKRSPLDKLEPAVAAELWTRCLRGETLRELQAWLKTEHRVRTSRDSLSRWNMRRNELLRIEAASGASGDVISQAVQIVITPLPGERCRVETFPL